MDSKTNKGKFLTNQGKLLTNQGKLLTKHKVPWFEVRYELTLANRSQCLKNIFLLQYFFIAILSVKMSRVIKALQCTLFQYLY